MKKKFFAAILFVSLFITANTVWAMNVYQNDKTPTKVENQADVQAKKEADKAKKEAKVAKKKADKAKKEAKAAKKKANQAKKAAKAEKKKLDQAKKTAN